MGRTQIGFKDIPNSRLVFDWCKCSIIVSRSISWNWTSLDLYRQEIWEMLTSMMIENFVLIVIAQQYWTPRYSFPFYGKSIAYSVRFNLYAIISKLDSFYFFDFRGQEREQVTSMCVHACIISWATVAPNAKLVTWMTEL